jgi:dGTPase
MNYQIKKRQQLEQEELKRLAGFALKNTESRGRRYEDAPDKYRLDFQRDRDRVLHSKSFRRLKGKTQVFSAQHGDHFRSRLTHTLEVAQISRSLARNLGANEDLAETIALAHDLGHTPFGHAGEAALHDLLQERGLAFEHNEQSRRIVEVLEFKSPNYPGLNLTFETREGLWKHRTPYDNADIELKIQGSLEGQIVDLADQIAYQNHDLDDGLRSGILQLEEVKQLPIIQKAQSKMPLSLGINYQISYTISHLIKLLFQDALAYCQGRLQELKPKTADDIRNYPEKIIKFTAVIAKENAALRNLLSREFYQNKLIISQSQKGKQIIADLFEFLEKNPQQLPKHFKSRAQSEELAVVIKDFIAGMTDEFALNQWQKQC